MADLILPRWMYNRDGEGIVVHSIAQYDCKWAEGWRDSPDPSFFEDEEDGQTEYVAAPDQPKKRGRKPKVTQ